MGTDTVWGVHNCHSCHTWCILYSKFVFFVDSQYRLIDCTVNTTRPEKRDVFAQRYQSQLITT